MRGRFQDFPEALGFYTGKRNITSTANKMIYDYEANILSDLGCKHITHHLISSAVQKSHDQNWLSYQIQAHCSCFEFPCWDNGSRVSQIFMSSFNSRMVQSSAGTQADAWRWKCPKMQILVFVWSSRDALVRSGWYVTGWSIPGTKARDPLDGIWLRVGFHTPGSSEKTQTFAVFARAVSCHRLRWASLRLQGFPTPSL